MNRFLRLYASLIRFSVSRSMEFRFDFFFRFLMDCMYYGVSFGFFKLLFLHTSTLGGWSEQQVYVFVAGGLLLDGLYMTLIARNVWEFPPIVNKGELDFYLTRPYPALLILLIRNFETSSFLNVLVGIGLLCVSFYYYPEPLGAAQIGGYLFLLANGFLLSICIRLLTVLPVFWTHSQFGFHMLFTALEQVQDRPETIFRGITHTFFMIILPLFVVTSFPARWFFGTLSSTEVLFALSITAVFAGVIGLIWRQGLRVYSSASS